MEMVGHPGKCLNNSNKWSDLLRLYKTDMSMREIAEHLQVGLTSLYSKVKELGLKRTPRRKKKPIDIKLFKELIKLGVSNITIANKLQVSTSTIIILKKQYGFESKDKQRIYKGKKGAAYRTYYKKTGEKPDCPLSSNILEQYKDDIIPMLKEGTPKVEIARKYGVCYQTVYNFIHMYDVHAPVKKICDNKEQFIKEAFASGESIEDISNKLNCNFGTVYKAIKSMNLSRLHRKIKRKCILKNKEEEIRQLYKQGVPRMEIAKRVGVTYQYLNVYIQKNNFENRPYIRRSVFDGHDEELMQMRKDKMTLEQIGKHFGVGITAVLHRIKKLQQNNQYQNI